MLIPLVLNFWKDDLEREQARDIDAALARAGISHKEAAICMGLDKAQWSKQRQGIGHPSAYRLAKLPPPFWREYCALRLERMGFSVFKDGELASALRDVMAMGKARMAGMALGQRRRKAHDVA